MKKLISKSLILVGVLIYGNANAQQNEITPSFESEIHIAQKEVKVHLIVNRTDNRSKFTVQLRNEQGQVMYRSSLSKDELQHRFVFDFVDVAQGNYSIEMQNGKESPVTKVLQKEYTVLAKAITSNKVIALN
ncbi:hypothetical protein [Runella sp.]|jgi:hypothetical protein|uniref:hypothetical protein n=1 Tax=Runella sp. TaxID=1960881 RepID=UPI00262BE714|nr:hypothetical protein [Runella sp.]